MLIQYIIYESTPAGFWWEEKRVRESKKERKNFNTEDEFSSRRNGTQSRNSDLHPIYLSFSCSPLAKLWNEVLWHKNEKQGFLLGTIQLASVECGTSPMWCCECRWWASTVVAKFSLPKIKTPFCHIV
jgi:hypothetical protein